MEASLKSPGAAASTAPASPAPSRDGLMTVRSLADRYMAEYSGRDTTRMTRLTFWVTKLGDMAIGEVQDDHVAHALDELAHQRGRFYAGKDADGRPILKAKTKPLSGPTLNRYLAAFSSLCTYAAKKRLTPRNWPNPCTMVEKQQERPGRLRFLDEAERTKLLKACKLQRWPRLYLLVLMALTTGCRRGELERLRWRDIDLEQAVANILATKNGEPRVAPLTDAVIEELRLHLGEPDKLVFFSRKRPDSAMVFDAQWHAALRAAGIRGFVFHGLRHTAASVIAMSGASLHDVGQVLGHKTLAMSARYSHLSVQHKTKVVRNALGAIR